ncbi:hypothetical protein C8F01DRAFT_1156252 [Mycena amicta]|nr:hypothetical protein C8F01DRAFT_1156252 [Mycena amicta]
MVVAADSMHSLGWYGACFFVLLSVPWSLLVAHWCSLDPRHLVSPASPIPAQTPALGANLRPSLTPTTEQRRTRTNLDFRKKRESDGVGDAAA